MLEVIYLITALLVGIWIYFYYKVVRHTNKFEGPPTNLLLGNALDLRNPEEVIYVFDRYAREYNGFAKVRVGLDYAFVVTDYNFIEFILSGTSLLTKSFVYEYLYRWLGTGLLTGGGTKWKTHRKVITPAFHFKILESFVDIFNAQTTKLVNKLSCAVGEDSVDIFPFITMTALDIICESAMGIAVGAQDNPNSEYVSSVKEMCRIIVTRASSPTKGYEWFYKFTNDYKTELKSIKILHDVTQSVISQRKKELEKRGSDINVDEEGRKRKLAFLDLLLQTTVNGQPMSDEDVRQEVDTFMFAGHDTTTAAMSFALYCLAQYPEIQQQVFNEQREIFGDDFERPMTQRDLTEMKYLENAIKETLRLYPPVPFYGRKITSNTEFGGRILPKNSTIIIFAYGIHRNPEYFPDPEKFDPSRFDNLSGKYPYAYIPFSAGPRNCIGQKYAMMEMKATISNVIRHYELLPALPNHELRITGLTVLRSLNGVRIRLKKRTT